ncbi:MAG: ATP-grasp domain-containing protein [Deltaproteobacteria bacterium]|nr:ATP-grasp domain-containing protein [Deltaproteobacteria bacterium]
MHKTLMVLGAGHGQLQAIQRAKERGYRVIATSCYPDDVGMFVADIPLPIDTTDIDKTLEAARAYKVDGIMTMGTDVAIPSIGKVIDELGLVGPSLHATLLSTNKVMMKRRLQEWNVPTAKGIEVRTLTEAKDAIHALGLPVMLKIVDSSGSREITKIDSISQLRDAFDQAKVISRTDSLLVEEFLDGLEFGAQGLVYKGKLKFVFPHNDTVTPPPYLTPVGHSYPMELAKDLEKEIFYIVAKCVEALGIDNSMLNVDLMMTSSGPKIIEIAARMGATCLPELTTIYSGIYVVDIAIEMAMGHELYLQEREAKQPCAALLIRSPRTGRLEVADIPQDLLSDSRLVAIRWDKKKGDSVRAFKVGPDRIGEIVVISDSWREAEQFCGEVKSRLVIKVT